MREPRVEQPPRTYTIDDLMDMGFSRRALQFYRTKGLLPPPTQGPGPGSFYDDRHVRVLREILAARDARRTLDEIAESLNAASSRRAHR